MKKKVRKRPLVKIGERWFRVGRTIYGQKSPVGKADRSVLKIKNISKDKQLIRMEYQNRFLDKNPDIAKHRLLTLSFREFERSHWYDSE